MSQSLSRRQAAVLGLVIVLALALGAGGTALIAARQGFWTETTEVTVGLPDANDIAPGTPVRIRGVEAGQVVAIEYPDHDGPDAAVIVRMKLDKKYEGRIYADATAEVHSTGLLGSKVIAIRPGSPGSGPLADGRLKAAETPDLAKSAAKLGTAADALTKTADETRELVHEVRTSNGTVSKLVRDDELYRELKGLATDSRAMVQQANAAVGKVEGEVTNVQKFVSDGRDTLRSVKQSTDAVQRMPIVRTYVEDATAILVRPDWRREMLSYSTADLFEPGTAILTDAGRQHLANLTPWLGGLNNDRAELVVAALCDPNDKAQTSASAGELTRKQAEAAVEFLKAQGAHKIGWVSRRKVAAVGLGFGPAPVVEKEPLPPSYLQVLVFTPQ